MPLRHQDAQQYVERAAVLLGPVAQASGEQGHAVLGLPDKLGAVGQTQKAVTQLPLRIALEIAATRATQRHHCANTNKVTTSLRLSADAGPGGSGD